MKSGPTPSFTALLGRPSIWLKTTDWSIRLRAVNAGGTQHMPMSAKI